MSNSCKLDNDCAFLNCQDEKVNLYDLFNMIPDFRRAQGKIYSLSVILIITTMSIMSGYHCLRAMGDFVKRNRSDLMEIFNLKRLPSHQTIGRVLAHIEFKFVINVFEKWMASNFAILSDEIFSLDGKVIGGTVTNPHNSYQEYVNMVSVFSNNQKLVFSTEKVGTKGGEIPIVRNLIQKMNVKGKLFTIDALHCQKDTLDEIVQSGNGYIVGIKKNQKNLYTQIEENIKIGPPIDIDMSNEKNKGRLEKRIVTIYGNLDGIHKKWSSIKSIIKIERHFERKGDKTEEIAYYISSLSSHIKAKQYNKIVRGHWLIENSLHYTKDTTFREDACKIISGYAPENLTVLRNIAINIFRQKGFKNLAQAIRLHSNDIWKMHEAMLA